MADHAGSTFLKWFSLFLLVVHAVGIVFIMRLSRMRSSSFSSNYLSTAVVFDTEVLKLVASLCLETCTGGGPGALLRGLRRQCLDKPGDLLRAGVPSLLFTLQNNFLFVALANLPGGTYQAAYQAKVLTTAAASVLILGTRLAFEKWIALVFLAVGVATVGVGEMQGSEADGVGEATFSTGGDPLVGFLAVSGASVTSALASVYMEKMLKQTNASIWMRNIQLSFLGSGVALAAAYWFDSAAIHAHGLRQGYTPLVWSVVVSNALGGLLIAVALKYADSIWKCLTNAIGIVFTCLISAFCLREQRLNSMILSGTTLVVISTCAYSLELDALGWSRWWMIGSTQGEHKPLMAEEKGANRLV